MKSPLFLPVWNGIGKPGSVIQEPLPGWLEKTNAEIAVPAILKTEDGREIVVQSWTPTVSIDDKTAVVITGIIRLPREEG